MIYNIKLKLREIYRNHIQPVVDKLIGWKFGVYCDKDKCWIGDENGPHVYEERIMARYAARVFDAMNNHSWGHRAKVLPYDSWVKKDSGTTEISAEEAIEKIERGIR